MGLATNSIKYSKKLFKNFVFAWSLNDYSCRQVNTINWPSRLCNSCQCDCNIHGCYSDSEFQWALKDSNGDIEYTATYVHGTTLGESLQL